MTTEEAIRILDPKTATEALAEIEYYGGFNSDKAKASAINEACRLAVVALRAQQDRENPKPLKLDELREMCGEPVWIEFIHMHASSKYRIVRRFLYNAIEFEEYDRDFGPYNTLYLGHYGKIWLAYRHKPKE